jgi:oligopeptidase A
MILPSFSGFDLAQFPHQLEQLLTQNKKNIDTLLASKEKWTWDNLIQPLEALDNALERFWSPLSHLHAVKDSAALRDCYQQCLPQLSAYESALGHHRELYNALQSIDATKLNQAQQKILSDMLRDFKLAGVTLAPHDQQRMETIDARLSELSNHFENNLLDAENNYRLNITEETRLSGIPNHAIHAAKEQASHDHTEGWTLTLEYPCYLAVLTYADDRQLREELHHAYNTRASDVGPTAMRFDNTPVMNEILALRHEKAKLLGFAHYADYSVATKMAKDTSKVHTFLLDLVNHAHAQAQQEFQALQTFAKTHYGIETLQSWDIAYVSQKKKQALFSLSDEALRPYFPLPHVLEQLFGLIHTLYGITFKKVTTPVDRWHDDVLCYSLEDETQQTRGYLYIDLFARAHKRGGAWMDRLQSRYQHQDHHMQLPIATLTCNFAKPVADHVPTLSHDEVETLFHEFGHCLHHLLTKVHYLSASGIHGVEWDAVELPSQIFENWCWEAPFLRVLSAHVDTKKPLPEEVIQQLKSSKNFQSAMGLMRQLEFALFDFRLHEIDVQHHPDAVTSTLNDVRTLTCVLPIAPYNRFPHGFSHIFAGGYDAGYYSYLWAEVLSSDAFSRFQKEGLFNTQTGHDFLTCVLEVGGSCRAEQAFVAFRGRAPRIDALLTQHGIK